MEKITEYTKEHEIINTLIEYINELEEKSRLQSEIISGLKFNIGLLEKMKKPTP